LEHGPKKNRTGRREFLRRIRTQLVRASLAGGAVYGFLNLRGNRGNLAGSRGHLGILRPPGAMSEQDFLANCIRCTRCADACETQCIKFFGPQAGTLEGTPYILPGHRGCNMCLECGKTCPTGAIKPVEKIEDCDMGEALVDKRLCVSLNGTGVCGACHTVCLLRNKAITLDIRNAPTVHPQHCTGCGMCQEICIVQNPCAIVISTVRTAPGSAEEEISL
jgi:ferredoxin-type protein NapG